MCVDIFREKGHQADVKNKLSVAELHAIIGDYDGMVSTIVPAGASAFFHSL